MRTLGLRRLWVLGLVAGCGSSTATPQDTDTASAGSESSEAGSLESTIGEESETGSMTGSMTGDTSTDATLTDATETSATTDPSSESGTDPDTSATDVETSDSDPSTSTDPATTDASSSSSSGVVEPDDSDNDGIPDDDDNCPNDANPQQEDDDNDNIGDLCDNDGDNDGLPDGDDPFPDDADLPGVVLQGTIYAHTSGTLYTMEVEPPYNIALVANFSFPNGSAGQVTDIAIDQYGVLYAVTFFDLFVCDPETAACYYLGDLPESHNALTFVPPGTVDANDDALIGIANSGSWRHLELNGNQVVMQQLGTYGVGYTSSGDSFSIDGVGTFASVNEAGNNAGVVIIEVDPLTGMALGEITTMNGYFTTYGLAGWEGAIFAFDSSGDVLLVDPNTGTTEVINDTNFVWWGAGVGTILPQ